MLSELYHVSWHRIRLRLTNTRNTYAREHPLSIFEALFKRVATARGHAEAVPFVFHVTDEPLDSRIRKDHVYPIDLMLLSPDVDRAHRFVEDLKSHLQNPVNNFDLVDAADPELRNLSLLGQEAGPLREDLQEICLEFNTPFPFTPRIKNRRWLLDKEQFARIVNQRLTEVTGRETDMSSLWEGVSLLPYYWQYVQIGHKPKSNRGEEEYVNGTVGPLYLKGPISGIYPILLLLSELHLSRKPAKGRGYFTLACDRAYLDAQMSDRTRYDAVWDSVERGSDMAEAFAEAFLDRDQALDDLHREIVDLTYRPAPFHGFTLEKRRGGERMIGSCQPKDHLVQRLLCDTLTPVMDRMFEGCSVGFRRGRSRETARAIIAEACREGFTYVLESDIASFFDRIDWDILMGKLRAYLPSGDRITLALLERCIKAPLELNGREETRTRGLIQGSPLSPMLSNLYLDAFDETMEGHGLRMVRYGDDLMVMAKTQEQVQDALLLIKDLLEQLGLCVKEEKTGIKPVDMGFSFLGLDFGHNLDEDFVEKTALRKALFVQNQYAFVGVDGDAVIIRKDGEIKSRLPIKRIGEIVIFGNNTISARFLHKCSQEKIPVSFCSPAGYYMNTLRPDSRQYFTVASNHGTRFEAMSGEDRIAVARRIVTAKIGNYLAWLGQRPGEDSRMLRHRLEEALSSLAKAESIQVLLGYEGEASSVVFRAVNAMTLEPDFHAAARLPHRKADRYNSLLDFAYFLLFTRINVLLRSQGLNPYLGFLHSHKDHYESLVTDLQEPFRCRMDRFVVKLINLKVIKPTDFERDQRKGWQLNQEAIGRFVEAFERECSVRLRGDGGTLKQLLTAQVAVLTNWVDDRGDLFFYESGQGRR